MILHTKYQSSIPEEDFKVFILKIYFSLCDRDMKWTKAIRAIIKEGHIRIIPTKFGQNTAGSLGGDAL